MWSFLLHLKPNFTIPICTYYWDWNKCEYTAECSSNSNSMSTYKFFLVLSDSSLCRKQRLQSPSKYTTSLETTADEDQDMWFKAALKKQLVGFWAKNILINIFVFSYSALSLSVSTLWITEFKMQAAFSMNGKWQQGALLQLQCQIITQLHSLWVGVCITGVSSS